MEEENSYVVKEHVESLDNVDFDRKINRDLSKSEADLKEVTGTARPLKSAPLYNHPIYHETTINITNVTLPGSVDVTVQSQVKVTPEPPVTTEKKVLKRTLSRKSTRSDGSFTRSKETISEVLAQLESNDWEVTIKGLKALVRLKKQNSDMLEPHLHNICVALGKQIKNLRSQVARAACTAAAEMFVDHKKSLEMVSVRSNQFSLMPRTTCLGSGGNCRSTPPTHCRYQQVFAQ